MNRLPSFMFLCNKPGSWGRVATVPIITITNSAITTLNEIIMFLRDYDTTDPAGRL